MSSLSRLEQETVASFNESEAFCELFTCSPRLKRRLAALTESRPDECKQTRSTPEGAAEYRFPKAWLRINPTRVLSETQKAERAKNFRMAIESHATRS